MEEHHLHHLDSARAAHGTSSVHDQGSSSGQPPAAPTAKRLEDLVFVGFNGRAFAVDRYDGTIVWRFKVPKGSGFVAVLLDGDRLVVSSQGYTYGLDPWRGTVLWSQEFSGEGIGVPSLASVRGGSSSDASAAAQAFVDSQPKQAAAGGGGAVVAG